MNISSIIKKWLVFITIALSCFCLISVVNASDLALKHSNNGCNSQAIAKGEGCFTYRVKSGNASIPVYYYVPDKLREDTKILFAMHGEERNAEDYRNDWRTIYDQHHNFIVLAPKFEQKWFPKAAGYNLGNMFTEDLSILNPHHQWAFTQIEHIFTFVKKNTGVNVNNYYLYGHSAGAQFVHRMVIFASSSAHIEKAVAAEAGSYTIPDEKRSYPCGLEKLTGASIPSVDLEKAFATPVTIILGTKDDQVLPSQHDSYACETQQGTNRLARGKYFYTEVKNFTRKTQRELNWTVKEVDAAHVVPNTNPPIEDPMLVSCAALEFFPKLTSVNCK